MGIAGHRDTHFRWLKDVNPGAAGSNPAALTVAGGHLFFSADDGAHGVELWDPPVVSSPGDGTPTSSALGSAGGGLVDGRPFVQWQDGAGHAGMPLTNFTPPDAGGRPSAIAIWRSAPAGERTPGRPVTLPFTSEITNKSGTIELWSTSARRLAASVKPAVSPVASAATTPGSLAIMRVMAYSTLPTCVMVST